MTVFIIQTLLLIATAFILGCLLGSVLHWLFGSKPQPVAIQRPKPQPVAKVAAKPDPKPAPAPAPKPTTATAPNPAKKDDLKRIRGIGPQNEARLNSIGVFTFAQVSAWSASEQEEIGERLAFPGRIEREDWVKQAEVLAKGGATEFSGRVDRGEVESSTGKASVKSGAQPPVLSTAPENGGDNLTLIDGVGNALEKKLFALGIYTFDQIAGWTPDQEAWIGNELGFPGRPEREGWVKEAKTLAAGGSTDHAKKVERGEIKTSRKS